MSAPIFNEEHRRWASGKIVALAKAILTEEIGIVAGARELSGLSRDVEGERDPDFLFFIALDSETDHLPVGQVRHHWNDDALEKKDEELRRVESSVQNLAFKTCRSLIQKYEVQVNQSNVDTPSPQ